MKPRSPGRRQASHELLQSNACAVPDSRSFRVRSQRYSFALPRGPGSNPPVILGHSVADRRVRRLVVRTGDSQIAPPRAGLACPQPARIWQPPAERYGRRHTEFTGVTGGPPGAAGAGHRGHREGSADTYARTLAGLAPGRVQHALPGRYAAFAACTTFAKLERKARLSLTMTPRLFPGRLGLEQHYTKLISTITVIRPNSKSRRRSSIVIGELAEMMALTS
jgi:hypothetical protein